MKAATEPLREMLLRQLTQNLPSDALVLCADGDDRPELIVVDRTYGLVVVNIDTTGYDPAAREPFSRLNRRVADLRLEVPVVERFRPHRLVLFGDHPDALIPPSRTGPARALGLADIKRGNWLERLEPRPPEPADLDALRLALAPSLVFRIRSRRGVSDPGRSERRKKQVALDAQQSAAATIPVDDVLLLSGPPGSGKTLVLAGRARYLAALRPDWRIVLLCYNKALVPYLCSLVNGLPNVGVTTFGKFSYAMGHKISLDSAEQADADLAAAKVKGIKRIVDALLIDEAQDFDDAWIDFALETVRLGHGGTVLSGDERQALYRDASRPRVLTGRRVTHLQLERSYRSTRQILEAAASALADREPLVCEDALDGQPVELIWAPSWDDQARAAAWEIRRMIDHGEREPQDIAVLITQWRGTVGRLRTALEGAKVPHFVIDRSNAATFDLRSPGVKIMTVHASKGYEFDVVVLFGLEALPRPTDDDEDCDQQARRGNVGFVGMTRARDQLLVTYTRDTPYLDRLRRCSSVSSVTWPDDYEV
jgi:UvrD-like helicase C-terminal domain/AAA domain